MVVDTTVVKVYISYYWLLSLFYRCRKSFKMATVKCVPLQD